MSRRGTEVTIHVAPEASAPMEPREAVRAVTGRGIEGDRYFKGNGFYSGSPGPFCTGQRALLSTLIHRGGIQAEILEDGHIRLCDPIEET